MDNKTEITSLGEFGLINHLTKDNKTNHPETIKAIGDDAAVIDTGDKYMLVSTDLLLEGIHFDLSYCPLKHLGYKSIIVNLSDIYAMNGQPKQVTVSIGMSNRFSLEAIEELYEGIYLACKQYNVDLVGGDTSSSRQGLVISVTAVGEVSKDKVTYRSGAKPNDLLVVSGDLGGSFMGLQILEREKSVFTENPKIQPDLGGNDYVLERQLKPEARKDVIEQLDLLQIKPTSMIDISDGLASETIHLCQQSKCGASIYDEKIPIDHTTYNLARDFELDPSVIALNGGEDYELLFTIAQSDYEKIKGSPYFTIIGHITDQSLGINLIAKNGTSHELTAQGWDAFLRKQKGL
ncbi:MAG: thiamine-phosphate kinase [Bacteroidetes bacterium]|nr:MAG: thiamine-phosphate kinase [Bacteroidota bacterium]